MGLDTSVGIFIHRACHRFINPLKMCYDGTVKYWTAVPVVLSPARDAVNKGEEGNLSAKRHRAPRSDDKVMHLVVLWPADWTHMFHIIPFRHSQSYLQNVPCILGLPAAKFTEQTFLSAASAKFVSA